MVLLYWEPVKFVSGIIPAQKEHIINIPQTSSTYKTGRIIKKKNIYIRATSSFLSALPVN